jgi:hypothetical protein
LVNLFLLLDGTCIACSILLELEGFESKDYNGVKVDLHGKTTLEGDAAKSLVFLRPMHQSLEQMASRRLFAVSTDGEKEFYIGKVIMELSERIVGEVKICAIGGGRIDLEQIHIGFAALDAQV